MKKWKIAAAWLLLICFLSGCSGVRTDTAEGTPVGTGPLAEFINAPLLDERSGKTAPASQPGEDIKSRLIIRTENVSAAFDPFSPYGQTGRMLAALTGVTLMGIARGGETVTMGLTGQSVPFGDENYTYSGIADVRRNGKVFTVTLNEDIYFSDGVNLTADDVIFSMYVLADPSYRGTSAFSELPIRGLEEYRGDLMPKWERILAAMEEGTDPVGEKYGISREEYDAFQEAFRSAGAAFVEPIIRSCTENFADQYSDYVLGVSPEELKSSRGLQVAFAEYFWGYASGRNDDGLWEESGGAAYDLSEEQPTEEGFWELIARNHHFDVSDSGINYEKMGSDDFFVLLEQRMESSCPSLFAATGNKTGASSISGIRKTGLYSLQITMTRDVGTDIGKMNIPVCPLHWYGNVQAYDYRADRFGFTKGDLNSVTHSGKAVLGAGPFQLLKAADGTVLLGANSLYTEGTATANLLLTDRSSAWDLWLTDGEADAYGIEVGTDVYTGVGFHVDRVKIGEDSLSDASCAFRRAIAEAVEAFLAGESDGLWARTAPLLVSAGFNVDGLGVTGNPEGAPEELMIRLYGNGGPETALREAAEWLKERGLPVTVEEMTSAAFVRSYAEEGSSDVWIMQAEDPWRTGAAALFSSAGKDNVFRLASEKMDGLLATAAGEQEPQEGYRLYADAAEELERLCVFIPLSQETLVLRVSGRVDPGSLPNDMTEHYGWYSQAYTLKRK